MKRNEGRCFHSGEHCAVTVLQDFTRGNPLIVTDRDSTLFRLKSLEPGILLFLLQTEENALRAHGCFNTNMRRLNTVIHTAPRTSVWAPFVSGRGSVSIVLSQSAWQRKPFRTRVARFRCLLLTAGDYTLECACAGPHQQHSVRNAAVNHHKGRAAANIPLTR